MGDGLVGDGARQAAVAAAVPRLERDVSLITDTDGRVTSRCAAQSSTEPWAILLKAITGTWT